MTKQQQHLAAIGDPLARQFARPKMTNKEKLVEAIRAEGYDFVTACEHATEILRRARTNPGRRQRYFLGSGKRELVITIARKGGTDDPAVWK